jgi:hypothetical protein
MSVDDLQSPGINIITEYLIGYLYPGHPVANVCFKVYGYISMSQALEFLQDFKLGHYMKVPPRAMFMAQVSIYIIYVFILGPGFRRIINKLLWKGKQRECCLKKKDMERCCKKNKQYCFE